MLDRDAASGRSGGLTNRVGLLLAAMILGSLVPVGISALVASRDPLPPSCHAGSPTAVSTPGELLFTDQSALSLVEGDVSQPRKLVDYASAGNSQLRSPVPGASSPAAPTAASPAPSAASAAPASPASATPAPSPSASPAPVDAQFLAAAISSDHRVVAYLVSDPPGGAGLVSLRVIDLSLPAPYAPSEAWNGPKVVGGGRSEIRFLPTGHILFFVPQRFDPPEKSTRLVGVALFGAPPRLVQLSPEEQFVASLHASWPETKDYQLPSDVPQLQDRVLGPSDSVAGRLDRRFQSPVTDRTVHQVATGRLGQSSTRVVCGALEVLTTAAFSPDGKTLAVTDGANSDLLDAGGGHSAVFLVRGRVMDWRA